MTTNSDGDRPPARRSGRLPVDEAHDLGERIMSVARDHFVRDGFNGTSMDAIAAAVPVTKRTLYQRFGSKRGLLQSFREWQRDQYKEAVTLPPPDGSLREKLTNLALQILDISLAPESRGMERLTLEINRDDPGLADELQMSLINHWTGYFRQVLEDELSPADTSAERIDLLADCLFDLLVMGQRTRIRKWRQLDDTITAKTEYIARILDIAADGIPALARDPVDRVQTADAC